MSNNLNVSDRFAVVKAFFDYGNRGDWDGIMVCLADNFVWEVVVFDGSNLRFSREAFKKHYESIPNFRAGEVSGDSKSISE